jgi:hypothetical protein
MDDFSCLNDFDSLMKVSPLSPHWLKKDFVTDIEAVFIYYNIEPIDLFSMSYPPEFYIQSIDKIRLWEIMKGSSVPIVQKRGILLKEFIEFLGEKEIPIPPHLQPSQKTEKIDLNSDEEACSQNLNSMRLVQLQRAHARTFAAIAWKKESNNNKSANALVTTNDFKAAMKLVGAEKINPETYAEWISDLSPRSKKKQK